MDSFKGDFCQRYYATAIIMFLIGTGGFTYVSIQDKTTSLERKMKDAVINYFDVDSNGLSFREDYKIKEFIGVKDSSKNYVLTKTDWKRAYDALKK